MPPKPQHNVHGIDSNAAISIDYDACIGCGMCGRVCSEGQAVAALSPSGPKLPPTVNSRNGDNSRNTETSRVMLFDSDCVGCGQCIQACAFNAIRPASCVKEIWAAKQAGKKLVAVLAPSTRVGISEAMGMYPGTSAEGQLIKGLRDLGFDYVFDNYWGADACTIEDANEALRMMKDKSGPALTSCCPAWVNFVEYRYPELIPHISSARSPHGIICSTIKKHWATESGFKPSDICVVGFMPCTAKKMEAARSQLATGGVQDCDISVTTRELAELFKERYMYFSAEKEVEIRATTLGKCDPPFNTFSGSAYIYGKTSGVTESVLRYLCAKENLKFDPSAIINEEVWKGKDGVQTIKILTMPLGTLYIKAAVAHGGSASDYLAKMVIAKQLDVDICEIMFCPHGCQNGGGQPRYMKKMLIPKRAEALEVHDKASKYGDCEHNAAMHEYVKKHMPTEHDVHAAFHTHFESRKQ